MKAKTQKSKEKNHKTVANRKPLTKCLNLLLKISQVMCKVKVSVQDSVCSCSCPIKAFGAEEWSTGHQQGCTGGWSRSQQCVYLGLSFFCKLSLLYFLLLCHQQLCWGVLYSVMRSVSVGIVVNSSFPDGIYLTD